MEPVSLFVGLLVAVGTGSLTKIGENITDKVTDETVKLGRSLWSILRRKAPDTATVRTISAGQEIDPRQAVIDVAAIAEDDQDPEVVQLLAELRSLLANNQELAAKVQEQMSQSKSGNTTHKEVNVDQSGSYNTQSNTFNF